MRVRIAVPLLLLAACLWPPRAEASLAREPIVRVLRRANDDLRACRERHHLPAGRYLVRLVIDPTGKVREVELGAGGDGRCRIDFVELEPVDYFREAGWWN